MRTSRRILILTTCLASAGLLAGVLSREHEPQYQGRPLSQWLRDFGHRGIYMEADPAVIAVRAIGTNAIPCALRWIRYEPSKIRSRIQKLAERLPPKYESYLISILDGQERAKNAETLFALLGPKAAGAIPALTGLAATSTTAERAEHCIDSLRYIGPDALPSFLILLTNGRARVRFEAASSVGLLGTNAAPAVPAPSNASPIQTTASPGEQHRPSVSFRSIRPSPFQVSLIFCDRPLPMRGCMQSGVSSG